MSSSPVKVALSCFESHRIESRRVASVHVELSHFESRWVTSSRIESCQVASSPVESLWVVLSDVDSRRVASNQVVSSHVKSRQVTSSRVESFKVDSNLGNFCLSIFFKKETKNLFEWRKPGFSSSRSSTHNPAWSPILLICYWLQEREHLKKKRVGMYFNCENHHLFFKQLQNSAGHHNG
jgi:hypothetical protein